MENDVNEIVRVVRVLEYVGTRAWLKRVGEMNAVKPGEVTTIFGPHKFIRELAYQELSYDGIAINKPEGGDQETKPTSDQ